MAIRGVSLSERETFISTEDPAHNDNLEAEYSKRLAEEERGRKTALTAEGKQKIKDKVAEDAGKPTLFYIGNLTKSDRIEIGDMTTTPTMQGQSISLNAQKMKRCYEIVQRGLVGWDNMLDDEGNAAPWKAGTVQSQRGFKAAMHEDCLALMSTDIIVEVATAILEKNGMTTALEKNFAGVSQLPVDNLSLNGDAPTAQTTKKEKEAAKQ